MKTTVKPVPKKSSRPTKPAAAKVVRMATHAQSVKMLTGQALIDDMREFRREVAATPGASRELLVKMGVLTQNGRLKTLVRA